MADPTPDPTNGELLDPETPIGQVRELVGDETPDPTSNAYLFSDGKIGVALLASGGSLLRACGILVKTLATQQTLAGNSIAADDFKINSTNRGTDLLKIAESYFKDADAADAAVEAAASAGELVIVNTRLRSSAPVYCGNGPLALDWP
ncbi:hypothetical protein [Pseudolysinimonas sp.]|uniref:hypothetical protein n=1 Tax=Pseudolysinimonas sp. TaxID=2680009 RepID=UPI003F80C623